MLKISNDDTIIMTSFLIVHACGSNMISSFTTLYIYIYIYIYIFFFYIFEKRKIKMLEIYQLINISPNLILLCVQAKSPNCTRSLLVLFSLLYILILQFIVTHILYYTLIVQGKSSPMSSKQVVQDGRRNATDRHGIQDEEDKPNNFVLPMFVLTRTSLNRISSVLGDRQTRLHKRLSISVMTYPDEQIRKVPMTTEPSMTVSSTFHKSRTGSSFKATIH